MQKVKVQYDDEANSLIVYKEGRKNYASIKLGEIIIDLDKNYKVCAIEILNPDILYKIPKERFSEISSASIQVQQRSNVLWIYIFLEFKESETQTLPVQIPLAHPISV